MSPHDLLGGDVPAREMMPDSEPLSGAARPSRRERRAQRRAQRREHARQQKRGVAAKLAAVRRERNDGGALVVIIVLLSVVIAAWGIPALIAGTNDAPAQTGATSSAPAEDPRVTEANAVITEWARLYLRGGDWQSLTMPANVAELATQRATVVFGAGSVFTDPAEATDTTVYPATMPEVVDGARYVTRTDVLVMQPAPASISLTVTIVRDAGVWRVSAAHPTFIGAV